MFGTFGYRDIAGKRINTTVVSFIARAYYDVFKPKTVTVASDTRRSSEALRLAVISALIERGADVHDLGVVPTPVAQHYTRRNTDGGIIITASHNPPEYNGIKLVDSNGIGIPKEDTIQIIDQVNKFIVSIKTSKNIEEVIMNSTVFANNNTYSGKIIKADAVQPYEKSILDFVGYPNKKLTIVFDASNATARQIIPDILRSLGMRVFTVNTDLDPDFTWRNPEPSPENISYLTKIVQDIGADFGVAVDGDADRAIFIDEKGNFIQGDKTFALITKYILENLRNGNIKGYEPRVVTTFATSEAIKKVAEENGAEVIITKIGDPYVSRKILETNAVIGGEENGGVMFPWHVLGRDSGMTIATIIKILSEGTETLSELISELPHYYQDKKKLYGHVDYKKLTKVLDEINIEYEHFDGVKIRTKKGWVLIRNSGTEPVTRIFAEATDEESLQKLIQLGTEAVNETKNIKEEE